MRKLVVFLIALIAISVMINAVAATRELDPSAQRVEAANTRL